MKEHLFVQILEICFETVVVLDILAFGLATAINTFKYIRNKSKE